jgi:hypothetical protein
MIMKSILLAIVSLFTVGMAPATQPANRELLNLQLKLASVQRTYGSQYPAVVQLRATIARLEANSTKVDGPATPSTQPCATSLQLLQQQLALLRFPYGKNYPETPEVISLKTRIAAMEASAAQPNSGSAPATPSAASKLLSAKIQLAAAQAEFGNKNPDVTQLQSLITRLELSGTKIDSAEANTLFKKLLDRRQQLLKTYGLRHPVVVLLTRKIDYLSTLLANDPVSD